MLHKQCELYNMAKGESGRIVVEVEPSLKRQLYSVLAIESSTLKDWFIQSAENYIKDKAESIQKPKRTRPGSKK